MAPGRSRSFSGQLPGAVEQASELLGEADGTAPLSYQWMLNGNNLAGATGPSLTLANFQPGQAGTYRVADGRGGAGEGEQHPHEIRHEDLEGR